jgi:hypothetical protein
MPLRMAFCTTETRTAQTRFMPVRSFSDFACCHCSLIAIGCGRYSAALNYAESEQDCGRTARPSRQEASNDVLTDQADLVHKDEAIEFVAGARMRPTNSSELDNSTG